MQSGINWTCLWLDLYQRIYKAAHSLSLFAFVSAAEYLSQQQLAADFRLKAEGHPSPAIFQQTVL